ncbi:MAG TPA: hypothetical protein VFR58_02345 [Flavisolibacter sp.]|nr:hypothetical protein [Flavisolibacter sp.]
MNNTISMSLEFERQKNARALAWTGGVATAVLLMIFFIKWAIPVKEEQPTEEYIEINLGSGDTGSGDDQPELPGDPAPAQQVAYTPPQPVTSSQEDVKDLTDENETSNDAPQIAKPVVSKPDARKVAESKTISRPSTTTPQPVAEAPRQPKAALGRTTGGNGNGGNGADTYRPGTGEGVAGGPGDQGRPGGIPNGRNYSGTPRNFGVKIMSIPNQTFEDDFNENAKVAMDIVVGENGKVSSATYQPKGSTTSDRKYIDIARRSAFKLNMGSNSGEKGTVIFNFKVKG